jgi:aminopeptidase
MPYTPPPEQLHRYADLLVTFALGGGAGIDRGDCVLITCPDAARPLYLECCRAVWQAGGHVLHNYNPAPHPGSNLEAIFYEHATDEQLDFFPEPYMRGVAEQSDHHLYLMADTDPRGLSDVPPARQMRRQVAHKPLQEWLETKENENRFSWTIAAYGTEAMASEARMGLEEYWEQIVRACYLDLEDPIARWRELYDEIHARCQSLDRLPIDRLHVEGEDIDLWLTLGEQRRWIGGGGRNIPSFEIFTSPDWRGTEGRVRFSEPLYTHGQLVTGVELEFREGRVVAARAQENEELLKEMIAVEGADRIGEFSLTDSRFSRIERFMANTLFDENVGGRFGNTHLAIGMALQVTYDGDAAALKREDWDRLGFNDSAVHTDIVSTADRTVTAVMHDGSERVIYADGRFTD